jgi:hypothetical protein
MQQKVEKVSLSCVEAGLYRTEVDGYHFRIERVNGHEGPGDLWEMKVPTFYPMVPAKQFDKLDDVRLWIGAWKERRKH